MSRQPSLRASCDRCGASKVRCDRAQPECQRCLGLGVRCVYGVSRKTGKPRQYDYDMREIACAQHNTFDEKEHAEPEVGPSRKKGSNDSSKEDIIMKPASLSFSSAENSTFEEINHLPSGTSTHFYNPEDLQSHPIESLSLDATGMSFGDDSFPMNLDNQQPTLLNCNNMCGASDLSFRSIGSDDVDDKNAAYLRLCPSNGDNTDFDCACEANDIISMLTVSKLQQIHYITRVKTMKTPTDECLSLDQVLSTIREASDRLERLLACSCLRSVQLALLYASIITRILSWYQRTASCVEKTSLTDSLGSEGFASANVDIGSLHVDDVRVQTVIRIQKISGEVRRAGHLIDQFSSYQSTARSLANDRNVSSYNTLIQNLISWLQEYQSEISNSISVRLRDLDP